MNNEELACNWFSTEYGQLADGLDAQSHVFLNLARGLLQLSEGHDEIMAWYGTVPTDMKPVLRSNLSFRWQLGPFHYWKLAIESFGEPCTLLALVKPNSKTKPNFPPQTQLISLWLNVWPVLHVYIFRPNKWKTHNCSFSLELYSGHPWKIFCWPFNTKCTKPLVIS